MLLELFRAIAARDAPTSSRLLRESPALAREALTVGASLQSPAPYFLELIGHYVYAGDTALHVESAAHHLEAARRLLALGASPNAKNRRGAAPLSYAADGAPGRPHHDPAAQAGIVALLIEAGASVNALDKSGVAPLHRAVRTRSSGAVRALLQHGADPLLRNASGSTPLHLAVQDTGRSGAGSAEARSEQRAVIELLLAHGARVSERNASGKSVTDCARADWVLALLGET